jgi:CheY-like chemotaxis protein
MLVEMQGGRLQLQSTVNRGSTFSFSLTFKKSSREPSQLESVTNPSFLSLNGLNILVVEDNPINQKIVCKLLAKWNAQTDIAENGLIALEKVRHNHYHLILMDLHMPEMNGYEAATKIREMEGDYYKFMPILALTASAFIEDRNKIFTHGMSGYIIKPFSPAELNWKISKFVHDNSPVI